MRVHRFFIGQNFTEQKPLADGRVPSGSLSKGLAKGMVKIANDELIHQWRHVLRFQVGQEVILFDNSGKEFNALIVSLGNRTAEVQIYASRLVGFTPRLPLFLFLSLAKRDSFEWSLEKGTELGVAGFIPVISERSEKKKINIERARNIVKETCEQSGRPILPEVVEPVSLAKALKNLLGVSGNSAEAVENSARTIARTIIDDANHVGINGKSFVLDPTGESFASGGYRKNFQAGVRTNVFIGPEGGFSPAEIELFESEKMPVYSLGRQILRAETATAAIASILLLDC